jgi:hypothetical protein
MKNWCSGTPEAKHNDFLDIWTNAYQSGQEPSIFRKSTSALFLCAHLVQIDNRTRLGFHPSWDAARKNLQQWELGSSGKSYGGMR